MYIPITGNLTLFSQEVRIHVVREISKELDHEKFHDLEAITAKEAVIEAKWEVLQKKLEARRDTLSSHHDLMSLFADMDDCLGDMAQTEVGKFRYPTLYGNKYYVVTVQGFT